MLETLGSTWRTAQRAGWAQRQIDKGGGLGVPLRLPPLVSSPPFPQTTGARPPTKKTSHASPPRRRRRRLPAAAARLPSLGYPVRFRSRYAPRPRPPPPPPAGSPPPPPRVPVPPAARYRGLGFCAPSPAPRGVPGLAGSAIRLGSASPAAVSLRLGFNPHFRRLCLGFVGRSLVFRLSGFRRLDH
jgi:hypothetical protein